MFLFLFLILVLLQNKEIHSLSFDMVRQNDLQDFSRSVKASMQTPFKPKLRSTCSTCHSERACYIYAFVFSGADAEEEEDKKWKKGKQRKNAKLVV